MPLAIIDVIRKKEQPDLFYSPDEELIQHGWKIDHPSCPWKSFNLKQNFHTIPKCISWKSQVKKNKNHLFYCLRKLMNLEIL